MMVMITFFHRLVSFTRIQVACESFFPRHTRVKTLATVSPSDQKASVSAQACAGRLTVRSHKLMTGQLDFVNGRVESGLLCYAYVESFVPEDSANV